MLHLEQELCIGEDLGPSFHARTLELVVDASPCDVGEWIVPDAVALELDGYELIHPVWTAVSGNRLVTEKRRINLLLCRIYLGGIGASLGKSDLELWHKIFAVDRASLVEGKNER